jgi:hypothetical protein
VTTCGIGSLGGHTVTKFDQVEKLPLDRQAAINQFIVPLAEDTPREIL